MRTRVTLTLEPHLVHAVDQLVDGSLLRNRSHAVEHLIREGLGLSDLAAAYLFVEQSPDPILLSHILDRLAELKLIHLVIVSSQHHEYGSQVATAAAGHPNPWEVEQVPLEFGTGGSLSLARNIDSSRPFVLVQLTQVTGLIPNLIPFFTFHRQHHSLLSMLMASGPGGSMMNRGIAIASPELRLSVPTGNSSLERDVYPKLAESGTVRAYVCS